MILDEDIPLCFRGHHFVSPESVGLVMAEKLPDKDTDIIDLVTSGCMKCYMERHNYDKRIIDRLEYITSQLILGKREFYYALLYFLNPKYVYSDKFSNIKELADYLEGLSDEEREKVAGEMIYDRKFQMWVFSKGYWKQLREWLSVCEKEDWE